MTSSELRENKTIKSILINMLIAAVSLFVNGFGIYLTIQANLGAAPWDVLNLGISKRRSGSCTETLPLRSPC